MRYRRVCVATIGLVALWASGLSATAVIALRTKDAVFVAGDTKTHTSGSERTFSSCKVVASEHAVVAFAGLAAVPAIRYELRGVLQQLVAKNLPFAEQRQALNDAVQFILPRVVEVARKISPAYRDKLDQTRGEILAVLIGGVDEGVPTWQVRHYFRRPAVDGKTVSYLYRETVCGANCPDAGVAILGGTDGLRRALRRAKGDKLEADWLRESTRIIGIAARESPDTIGLPVAALRVDREGVHWLQNPEECRSDPVPAR